MPRGVYTSAPNTPIMATRASARGKKAGGTSPPTVGRQSAALIGAPPCSVSLHQKSPPRRLSNHYRASTSPARAQSGCWCDLEFPVHPPIFTRSSQAARAAIELSRTQTRIHIPAGELLRRDLTNHAACPISMVLFAARPSWTRAPSLKRGRAAAYTSRRARR